MSMYRISINGKKHSEYVFLNKVIWDIPRRSGTNQIIKKLKVKEGKN